MTQTVRVVSMEARPQDAGSDELPASGAFVNAYVMAPTDEAAIERAMHELALAGWLACAPASSQLVEPASLLAGSQGEAYYEQCLLDGCVLAMHCWRHEH
jgi:hypothetical protein